MNCVDVVTLMPEVASEMCRFCMTLISPTQAKFCLDWSADGPNADVRQLLEKLIDQQVNIIQVFLYTYNTSHRDIDSRITSSPHPVLQHLPCLVEKGECKYFAI